MAPLWRDAIERAGGVEHAVLFGPPLKALVDELEERAAIARNAGAAVAEAADQVTRSGARASEAASLLDTERTELRRLTAQQAPLEQRLRELERLIEAYEWMEPTLKGRALKEWERVHGAASA
ncbi:MAG TPA: hypothetical protein VJN72_13965 [Gaiellales bacterium]|nr:hypothetical protein [Gaiellales bacterium]